MTQETWANVPGFVGYQVSDLGRVRSRRMPGCGKGRSTRFGFYRILKLFPDRAGYLCVNLRSGNRKIHQKKVHVLVLMTFIGAKPIRMQARHFPDRNKSNNRLSNLSWATAKVNNLDKIAHGTIVRGERQAASKFTVDDVVKMRQMRRAGMTLSAIQQNIGKGSLVAIGLAVRGKTWAFVPME